MIVAPQKNDELATPKTAKSLKGHLLLKSSVLATDNCKLQKQYMIAQNMASHYRRILNVKSSIDTKPPKSIVQSQRARDRAKRETILNPQSNSSSVSRPNSRPNSRPRSADVYRSVKSKETLFDNQTLNTFRDMSSRSEKFNKSMSNMWNTFTHPQDTRIKQYSTMQTHESIEIDDNKMDKFFGSSKPDNSLPFKSRNLNSTSLNSVNPKLASVLNDLFNPSLKAMSRLAAGRTYDVLENHSNSFKQPEKEFVPRIKNRNAESKLKQAGYYNPPRPRKKTSNSKPSIDETANATIYESIFEDKSILQEEPQVEELKKTENRALNKSPNLVSTEVKNETNKENSRVNSPRLKELTTKRIAEREEEILYLGFIKEVTDDIISRGVCTNRVINNIFDYHVNRNKEKLNPVKMRELLATLRVDLGMTNDDDEDNTTNQYSTTIRKATMFDTETQSTRKSSRNSETSEKYLTLDKFGWNKDYEKPPYQDHSNNQSRLSDKTVKSSVKNPSSRHSTSPAPSVTSQASKQGFSKPPSRNESVERLNTSHNEKVELTKQQNEIIKNIDSIRKTNRSASVSPISDRHTPTKSYTATETVNNNKEDKDEMTASNKDELDGFSNDSDSADDTDMGHSQNNNLLKTLKYDHKNVFKKPESPTLNDDDDTKDNKSDNSLNNSFNFVEEDLSEIQTERASNDTKHKNVENLQFNKTLRKNSKSDDDENTFTQSISSSIPKPTPRKSVSASVKNHSDDSF